MILKDEITKFDLRREFNKGYQKGVKDAIAKAIKLAEKSGDTKLAKELAELSFE